ncbi:MAG TPA: tRNA 2-thiocytidine biosynthesis protein TtcA [Campylobacterales bacterium]|nr:tRNA 2-thiocytidine biosynthesis protein TtcA [Campylobacterales bacterium]HIO70759.1 tRNA 2-thiocytidine biosynthesis protein TtcA [Campylobacterales bacterium]
MKRREIEISKKLLKIVGRTNGEFGLIEEGDRIVLGLSGGKDSLMLAHILKRMERHAPFKFQFTAVTIDYGMGEDFSQLTHHLKEYEIPHHIYKTDIFEIAQEKIRRNSSYCSFFSRMRRGALYSATKELGYNKLALGHHLDDAVESFFMNIFYNSTMRTLAPKYTADNGIVVIRPLIQVRERQLLNGALKANLPIIGDEACPSMRFDIKVPYARYEVKSLLKDLEKKYPNIFFSLNRAFKNIHVDSFFNKEK